MIMLNLRSDGLGRAIMQYNSIYADSQVDLMTLVSRLHHGR